jgi:hypothetical protein
LIPTLSPICFIPLCFQDETKYGTVVGWRDHGESTKNW